MVIFNSKLLVYQRVSSHQVSLERNPCIIDVDMCAADDQCSKTLIPFNPGGSYKVVPPKAKCLLVYNPQKKTSYIDHV